MEKMYVLHTKIIHLFFFLQKNILLIFAFKTFREITRIVLFGSTWWYSIGFIAFSDSVSDLEEVDIVPESQEPQPDSPAEDVVSITLKRENSLRHSQRHALRNGRFVLHKPHMLPIIYVRVQTLSEQPLLTSECNLI